ncbi:hypothetical protein OK016_01030 [Vibrio chagasii]|nr:hypothetical protein [Vibrio chagasii]
MQDKKGDASQLVMNYGQHGWSRQLRYAGYFLTAGHRRKLREYGFVVS